MSSPACTRSTYCSASFWSEVKLRKHGAEVRTDGVTPVDLAGVGVNLQVDRGVLMTRDGALLVHELLGHNLFGQMGLNRDLKRRAPGFQQLAGSAHHLGDKRVLAFGGVIRDLLA